MLPIWGIYTPYHKGYFTPLAGFRFLTENNGMATTFIQALQLALQDTGKSVRSIASATGIPYERLKQVARGRTATTNADDAYLITQAFGVSMEDFMEGRLDPARKVSIAGKVGAGAHVPAFDTYEKGDGPHVICPPRLSPHGLVAVEIEGESMEPVYSAGDLLFYTRPFADGVPSDVLGHKCVCEDDQGMGWVKQVKPGDTPGLYHLISLNPGATTMWNVKLLWAARVRLHWPAELATRL